jgi:CRISPR-associated protein Csd1
MLLQRLVSLSRTLDSDIPAFYAVQSVRWQLNLTADGELASPELLDLADPSDKARKNGVRRAVPSITKTSGDAPAVGTDTGEYLLGWFEVEGSDDEIRKRQIRAEKRVVLSRNIHQRWAESLQDPRSAAVASFFDGSDVQAVIRPSEWRANQRIQVAVAGIPAADLPILRTFWAREAQRRKSGDGKASLGLCLVCGGIGSLLDTLPQQLNLRLTPLATRNAALVSANKQIHTYDHTDKLVSTIPICIDCGRRAVDGLSHVLGDEHSHLQFGDSRLAWWTVNADPIDLVETLAVNDPETVASLVDRVRRTGAAPTDNGIELERFCAITVAGNVSRVMIRDWIDMPLTSLERNVAEWFTDHRIDNPHDRSGYQPLWLLVLATGKSTVVRDARREYARLDAKGAQRPDDVGRALLRSALLRKPLPASLLSHLVTRIRTDRHLDDPRAALLRLALTRILPPTKETPMPGLDTANRDPAYLAGRIFAALENVQDATRGRQESVNTTFVDRYFAGAVANPRIALVQGRSLASPRPPRQTSTRARPPRWVESGLSPTACTGATCTTPRPVPPRQGSPPTTSPSSTAPSPTCSTMTAPPPEERCPPADCTCSPITTRSAPPPPTPWPAESASIASTFPPPAFSATTRSPSTVRTFLPGSV